MVVAGSDIPVDIADVITILVFAHFRKCHASSLKSRVVLSRKYILGETSGFNVDFTYFF